MYMFVGRRKRNNHDVRAITRLGENPYLRIVRHNRIMKSGPPVKMYMITENRVGFAMER